MGKSVFQNHHLSDEGIRQAIALGPKFKTILARAEKPAFISSPLNRCVQTWFCGMTDFVINEYGNWNQAVLGGVKLSITYTLREAQDSGTRDSFGSITIPGVKADHRKAILACVAVMRKMTKYDRHCCWDFDIDSLFDYTFFYREYLAELVNNVTRHSRKTKNKQTPDVSIAEKMNKLPGTRFYHFYKPQAVSRYRTAASRLPPKSWNKDLKRVLEEGEWRWDNRQVRNKMWKIKKDAENDRKFRDKLDDEIGECKTNVIKPLQDTGHDKIIMMGHGRKFGLWLKRDHVKNASIWEFAQDLDTATEF